MCYVPPHSLAAVLQDAADSLRVSAGEEATLVCYVPPHGLAAVLRDAADVLGGARLCCVARELTKVQPTDTLSVLV